MKRKTRRLGFFAATAVWSGALVAVSLVFQVVIGLPPRDSWSLWDLTGRLTGWVGLFLPYTCFAGGVAVYWSLFRRSVALRAALVGVVSFVLLAYVSPIAEYQSGTVGGEDVAAEFPFGPDTPSGLRALRSAVEANPPASYSFSVERPLDSPPNWLTFLLHSLVAIAGFAVLAALLGHQVGFLTNGLSPAARSNARWALGFLSAAAFFIAEAAGGEWVRLDPSNSGIVGAWLPMVVPFLEFVLLEALVRQRRLRLHGPDPPDFL